MACPWRTMACPCIAVLILLASLSYPAECYDPPPVRDFDIPGKLPGQANSSDFVSTLLRGEPPVAPGQGAGAVALGVGQFPGLNTQGISATKLKIMPCGMNPPHVHPRGTELLYVLEGRVFVAFVDTANKIFANVLKAGDTTVFPRGLIHTVVNIGKKPALVLAVFNSQNPGNTRVAPALFKSRNSLNETFPTSILATAFGVKPSKIKALKKSVSAGTPLGNATNGCSGRFSFLDSTHAYAP